MYYHAIRENKNKSVKILDSILKEGIRPFSETHASDEIDRMNYEDEICLCKVSRDSGIKRITNLCVRNTVFDDLLYGGYVILGIDDDIKGIFKPEVLPSEKAISLAERGVRGFTEYDDEYRTKVPIPSFKINRILFPASLLISAPALYEFQVNGQYSRGFYCNKKERIFGTVRYYESIKELLEKHNRSIPIYDSSTGKRLDSIKDIYEGKKR